MEKICGRFVFLASRHGNPLFIPPWKQQPWPEPLCFWVVHPFVCLLNRLWMPWYFSNLEEHSFRQNKRVHMLTLTKMPNRIKLLCYDILYQRWKSLWLYCAETFFRPSLSTKNKKQRFWFWKIVTLIILDWWHWSWFPTLTLLGLYRLSVLPGWRCVWKSHVLELVISLYSIRIC